MDKTLAIEENGAEFLMAFGRAAGSEERDDGRVQWAIGGSPIDYFNCVVHADLAPEEADQEIRASLERMRAHDVPGSWHVGPRCAHQASTPAPSRTASSTASRHGDGRGLSTLPEEVPAPADFVVERVIDETGLAGWAATFGSGFGIGPVETAWFGEMLP